MIDTGSDSPMTMTITSGSNREQLPPTFDDEQRGRGDNDDGSESGRSGSQTTPSGGHRIRKRDILKSWIGMTPRGPSKDTSEYD